ncbi:uncharacterized protein LOC128775015 [Panthera pardus]|uniref:Uncharacterized protein LOC128775015 n=1 Tax=Panthera pardus TaxID=9691 RepID=A0A9W2UY53_PANPR|nr:uncharacterized protein LOC128775015 [Panthera pardus]
MEPETSAQSSPCLDEDHPWPLDFDEINTGFCDQSVTYSEVKAYRPSNVEKRKTTRNLKTNETTWCLVAMLFVFIYLIFLVLAAVMTAKARCLEEVLISYENETAHCKVI